MNKHTVIVIVASIVIALPFVYAGWNIYGAEQIQFSGAGEKFTFFEMVNDGKINVCNTLPFYVNFDKIETMMFYEGKEKGVFSIQNIVLPPSSTANLQGVFSSEIFEEAQYLALHFDGMYSGATPVRIDPVKLDMVTEIHTSIMGIIPYSVTKQFSGIDFWNMMNENIENSCT